MTAPQISQAALGGYFLVALISIIILRRTYSLTRGTPVRTTRLVILPVIYVALYVSELAGIWYAGAGSSQTNLLYAGFGADVVLLIVGTLVAERLTRPHVELYQPAPDGDWWYRLRPFLPILYVVLFVVRIGLEAAVIGESPFSVPTPAQYDAFTPVELYSLFAVDALWGLTTGFLIGRSWAVYALWKSRTAAAPPASGTALP